MLDPILHAMAEADRPLEEGRTTGPWVTLFIRGAVISGRVVSEAVYCDLLFGALSPKFKDALAAATPPKRAGTGKPIPDFIHLADVQIVSARDRMLAQNMFWRGRLRSIDGFGCEPV